MLTPTKSPPKRYIPGTLTLMSREYADYYDAWCSLHNILREHSQNFVGNSFAAIKQTIFYLEQKMLEICRTPPTHS